MLKVFTVATHSERYFPILIHSAKKYNYDIHVLGWQEEWKGLNMKFKLMRNALQSLKNNDIVMFVDGFDTFFIRDSKHIIKTFLELETPILMSGEKMPSSFLLKYAYNKLFSKNKIKNEGYCFINTGMYMGYRDNLLMILNYICQKYDDNSLNDQIIFGDVIHRFNTIHVDNECHIFLNVWGKSVFNNALVLTNNNDLDYKRKNIIIKKYNTKPFIIQGPFNTDLSELCKKLFKGIHYPEIDKKIKWQYLTNQFTIYSKHFKTEICIILFLLFAIIYYASK